MKKITLFLFFLVSFSGFSQTPLEKIKTYMNENRSKFELTNQDISDLVIVNSFDSETTRINNYHVKQRHNGIEVFNSDSNFWIKNDKVIHGGEDFIQNVSQKINTITPTVGVVNGVLDILTELDNTQLTSVQVLESSTYEYTLSNGILANDPIHAKLVYFLDRSNALRLSWDYEFYSQDAKHLWVLKVDAVTGKIIDKRDQVISCNFSSNHSGHAHNTSNSLFTQNFYKQETASNAMLLGTMNYRVIPWNYESPNHSPRQLVSIPTAANASPNGWHNTNNTIGGGTVSTRFNITRGNNVFAYDDVDGNNAGGTSPTASATSGTGNDVNLTFDFAYPGTSVAASTYLNAATTNLFYMNNIMHDVWYQYGFTETNGNFQTANYSRGGSAGDAVNAEAQDGSQISPTPNLNNANFSTPSTGAPRMQMFLWDVGPSFFNINSPADVAGGRDARDNSFSPGHVEIPLSPAPAITGNLVLFNDGVGPDTSDACTAATNGAALSGNIAVIRRGDCTFALKVKIAQDAGAIAVVIVNNVTGIIGMAGADATITIPAISVTQEVGEALITRMQTATVNASLQRSSSFVNSDGDFDNGIIAHEYGHGISSRLSGNCLSSSEQQGEGWSDWFWLMMQIKPGDTRNDARGIGTFANNQAISGPGIREFRYSTNMAVNSHTFGDTNGMTRTDADTGIEFVDVHSVGSVWAAMLWDLAWDYIDKYGYDPNIYTGTGGNNKVMRLVLDGIKLDGCAPSFVSSRDALIAADQATTGGQDYCLIWKAFARRGLGANASSGTNLGTDGINDQIEDFTEPAPGPNCILGVNYFENDDMVNIYPNPSNGLVNIKINQFNGKVNLKVVDLNGRVVYSLDNTDFNVEKTINLNHLQSGMYLVKIDGDDLSYTKKVILN